MFDSGIRRTPKTGLNRYCDSGVHTLPSRDTHAQTTLGPTCRPCELRRSYRARGEADPGEERSGASGGQGGYLQLLFYGRYGAFSYDWGEVLAVCLLYTSDAADE